MKLVTFVVALVLGIGPGLHAQDQYTRVTLLANLRIGDQRDSNYTLSGIYSLAMLPRGGIVVIDVGGRGSVRMYDRNGVFVRHIARPGQGPNEFGSWAALALGTMDDMIWLADRQRNRIVLLDTLGMLRSARSRSPTPTDAPGSLGFPSVMLADGTGLIEPGRVCEGESDWSMVRAPIRRVDSTGKQLNELGDLRLSPCGERVATGRNSWVLKKLYGQFTDEPLWAWQPGGATITLVDRDAVAGVVAPTFRVRRLNADGSIIFDERYPYTPIALTRAAMDSAKTVSLGTSVTDAARAAALAIDWHFPAHMPTVSRVMVGYDGSTWLQREAQAGSRRNVWTLIDPAGNLIGDAGIPAGITPMAADATTLWGVEKDANDVPTIVRFRMIYVTRSFILPPDGGGQ